MRNYAANNTRTCTALYAVLFCLLLPNLAGCSFVALGYRNSPTLLLAWLDRYFDFDSPQRHALKHAFSGVLSWHRRERLPLLADALDDLAQRVGSPLTLDDVNHITETVSAEYHLLAHRLAPSLAVLAEQLSAEQRAHLERAFERDQRRQTREYLTPSLAKLVRKREHWIEDSAEDWLGQLNATQSEWLTARLAEVPPDYSGWSAHRAQRQKALLTVLKTAAPGPGMTAWLAAYETSREPNYQAHIARMRAFFQQLVVDLVNNATPAQRKHLRERLEFYRDELREVAGGPSPSSLSAVIERPAQR